MYFLIGVVGLERTNDDCHSVRMQMRERPLKQEIYKRN
uniref:Uncharacterized protein n=1 Tax=Escherichia coli TaxID=562 RepID=A0A075MBZ7_ECOLX|nr:hypothetical protein [Escherichia coli]